MGIFDSVKSMLGGSGKSGGGKIDLKERFALERTAVTGTMAKFFAAKDLHNDGKIVGVKVLDPEKVEAFESRFRHLKKPSEGEIAMKMHHRNIVETYEVGVSTDGNPVLIMEYIAGPSMQNIIVKKQEEHVAGRRLALIKSMAEALRYVHALEFIHRDICPRNFILTPDRKDVKLIDFGLTVPALPPYMAPGNRTGTPLYMSPEIVRRRPTDKRVDLFSLGVTYYCLIAFRHPWQGDEVTGRAALHHDTSPPLPLTTACPNVSPALARTIMQMIEPKVDDRTPTIEHFIQSLARVKEVYVEGAASPAN
ncbi:serine/threonine protein kinase [Rhodopirellula sp. MGV]|uniref:serine/threonine protein kinase n=1 Tax=Rhodopirellula sp. MGV TaxID=2023130 RepID=UPI000B96F025|nr:serine/threonine-protein kinase [Rhodopirellula sp. MGV]OYP28278.1 protein kinase [Rhodopirellula sp. MGV]PNY38844.1 serine/threonine protein kinase [Rhodopirellula baltica]